ncbi:Tyrosine-protein kinase RYK [Gryllus bimaculatus]|nr:Tyrosine-protein kinase RYK [Gryllus bimaculatus]
MTGLARQPTTMNVIDEMQWVQEEDPAPRNDSVRLQPGSLVTSSGTFYVAVGCACAMIVVVVAVTSVVYVKSKKARTQESLQFRISSIAYVVEIYECENIIMK